MANVYTKRTKLPRTTTLSDYGFKSRVQEHYDQLNKDDDCEFRLNSPTRRQNPQPIGLVYQSPYNRHNQIFGIWNPNLLVPILRSKETLPHLRSSNFSCKHNAQRLESFMTQPDHGVPIERKQPKVHYTRNTTQRECFQWPPTVPEKFQGMVKTSRFGHTPDTEAVGIVPKVIILPNTNVRESPVTQEAATIASVQNSVETNN